MYLGFTLSPYNLYNQISFWFLWNSSNKIHKQMQRVLWMQSFKLLWKLGCYTRRSEYNYFHDTDKTTMSRFCDNYFNDIDYFLYGPKMSAWPQRLSTPLPKCEPKPKLIPIYLFYKMSSILCILNHPYMCCIAS